MRARGKAPTTGSVKETLVFIDEPQLIVLKTSGTSLIISVAIDRDGYEYGFLGAEISAEQYGDYLGQRIDLKYLFENPYFGRLYFFDLGDDGRNSDGLINLFRAVPSRSLEEEYFPESGFFARNHNVVSAKISVPAGAVQVFGIDGAWNLADFSAFGDRLTQIYAVYSSAEAFANDNLPLAQRREILDVFLKPYQGGSSYVALYNALPHAVETRGRLPVRRIQYNSPGEIEVIGKADMFKKIKEAVTNFKDNEEQLNLTYKALKNYISANGFAKLDSKEFIDDYGRSGDIPNALKRLSKALIKEMPGLEFSTIYDISGKNPLVAGKVLLSFYRRIEKLVEFFDQGRVVFR